MISIKEKKKKKSELPVKSFFVFIETEIERKRVAKEGWHDLLKTGVAFDRYTSPFYFLNSFYTSIVYLPDYSFSKVFFLPK